MNETEKMTKLVESINKCKKCDLYKTRKKPVTGEGSLKTKLFLVGEAPGYNEDMQGRPFVGKAGKILDELLESINLNRNNIYIANILKCRPPNNRNPLNNEIDSCAEYLNKQIEIIKPGYILPMGNFASEFIFKKFGLKIDKISKIHGKIHIINTLIGKVTIIPLYHPAIATYNPNNKKILFEDFNILKKLLNE